MYFMKFYAQSDKWNFYRKKEKIFSPTVLLVFRFKGLFKTYYRSEIFGAFLKPTQNQMFEFGLINHVHTLDFRIIPNSYKIATFCYFPISK